MRADVCQEILLAIYEGRTTIDQLRTKNSNARYYIKKFYHDNYEDGGHAISFQDTNEDWNSDAVASSIAAKEWRQNCVVDIAAGVNSIRTFTPPTQFEAAWRDQVGRIKLKHHELGRFLSTEEVEEMLNDARDD
jgi:hypothetical protein